MTKNIIKQFNVYELHAIDLLHLSIMKNRLFFQCSYDGCNYSGWQKQPNAITIEEEIEKKLAQLFPKEEIKIVGCGRTDAGVHSLQSFFHIDLPQNYSLSQLHFKLNNMLPKDIAIDNIFEVDDEAHARFDATKRTYHYFIHQNKSPFLQNNSWFFPHKLNVEDMNEAANLLLGKQDFTSFSKLHTDVNNNFCEIYSAKWEFVGKQLRFEICANRFLRGMVRAIVGTLLEVGQGKIEIFDIQSIIQAKNRSEAGCSVPAKGLYLAKVEYPYID